jgi:UDP-N-acetyl-2-amino-2-deoxyglucuronate dehydrogenase
LAARIRVAFAGVHRQLDRKLASHSWAAAFAADSRTEMVGVFDRGPETLRQFRDCWGDLPAFDDYAAMLRDVRPDIVCIATRQTMHVEQVEQAAAAGVRGILCDKPLATSMGEVDRIVAACRRHGVRLAFGLDRRWVSYYAALTAALRDDLIGPVHTIVAYGMPNLINHGPHWYDRVLAMAGDAELEWASGLVDPLTDEAADSRRRQDPPGSGQIRFANGVEAFLTSRNLVTGFDMSFDVVGSRGRVVVQSDGRETRVWAPEPLDPPTLGPGQGPPWVEAPPFPAAVTDLFDALAADRPTRCDLDHARRASEIGFAIHQASRQGGRRVTPAEIDRDLRVESFAWGNE